MIYQKGHLPGTPDRVFVNLIYNDSVYGPGLRGDVIVLDIEAATKAAGKLGSYCRKAYSVVNVYVVGVLDAPVVKGQMAMVQCYGYHDAIRANSASITAETAGLAKLVPDTGGRCGNSDVNLAANGREIVQCFAVQAQDTTGSETSVPGFIEVM